MGGREVSLCKVDGEPDIRCEIGWLVLQPGKRSVNGEVISREALRMSAALVTADFVNEGDGSRLAATVQLSSLARTWKRVTGKVSAPGMGNLAAVAERTMVLQRAIRATRAEVWGAWTSPETLPRWWVRKGFPAGRNG